MHSRSVEGENAAPVLPMSGDNASSPLDACEVSISTVAVTGGMCIWVLRRRLTTPVLWPANGRGGGGMVHGACKFRPASRGKSRSSGYGTFIVIEVAAQSQLEARERADFSKCMAASRRGAQCPNFFDRVVNLASRSLYSPREYESGRATWAAVVQQGE